MLNGSLVTSPATNQTSCIFFYFKFVVEAKVPVPFSCEQEPTEPISPAECPVLQRDALGQHHLKFRLSGKLGRGGSVIHMRMKVSAWSVL